MQTMWTYKRYRAALAALICALLLPLVALAETAYVTADYLILRKTPATNGAPITQIPQGKAVQIKERKGEWVLVTYQNHKGYVFGTYLAQSPQEKPSDKPKTEPKVGAALRLGDTGAAVRALQNQLKQCGYSVAADGVFGAGTEAAVIALQTRNGLNADGVVGTRTQQALAKGAGEQPAEQPAAPKQQSVEKLDWWQGGAEAFSLGSRAVVVDVRTGKRFSVRRWGGVNHADCEPLTKDDSDTMRQIYGGAWSWNRRPVWVIVGGRTLAASMNGMPHGGMSIQDNGFDGHFCIHMQNSRTHGSNRVDEAHQAAVSEAYEKRGSFR